MKSLSLPQIMMFSFAGLLALTVVLGSKAHGATETVSQTDRISAINKALDEALKERAKSESDFDRSITRAAERNELVGRTDVKAAVQLDIETPRNREKLAKEMKEQAQREKRLNWLND